MKKQLALLLTCLFVEVSMVMGQSQSVTGIVVFEEDGQPVIGASILIKGTTVGTITDIDGKFTLLDVPGSSRTLLVSYIGMVTQEVTITPNVRIVLKSDSQMIEEVIVTGYGNFKKGSFTGSASTVNSKGVEDVPVSNLQSMMSGSIAGVNISANSGQLGGFASMRIRGSGSISASNNPLYVIDGVPVFHDDVSQSSYAKSGTDPMSLINPADIEDITVIKDAAAASLYGSRAANGVVLITTKRGKTGKPVISLKADWGFSDFAINWRPTLGGDERRELLSLGFKNFFANQGDDQATAAIKAEERLNSAQWSQYVNKPKNGWVNWKDLLLRTGYHSNYAVNVRGGDEKTTYFASAGYANDEGISIQSTLSRYSGRVGVVHNSDRWKIDANSSISKTLQQRSNEGTSYSSPIMAAYGTGGSPAYNPYNDDGSYATTGFPLNPGSTMNPLASAKYNFNKSNLFRSMSSAKLGYRIWDELVLSQRISYDYLTNKEIIWWDGRTGDGFNYKGLNQTMLSEFETIGTQTQLTYQKKINEVHQFDVLGAFETEQTSSDYTALTGIGFPNPGLQEIISAVEKTGEAYKHETRLMSFLGRLNYSYADKYYLSANFRSDGTSRLSQDTRWGTFWALSGAWRISNEKFFEPLKEVVTDAKIRISYGTNGNLPDDWYPYMGIYKFAEKYAGSVVSVESELQNNTLRWEKNAVTNLGLDLTFLNNLISVSLDFYNRDTKDLLYKLPISQTTGFETYWSNIAKINNKGVEIDVKSNIIAKDDFNWTASFNLAYNKNVIKKIGNTGEPVISGMRIMEVGKSLNSIYAYEYAGVDPATGKESFYINKEGSGRETTVDVSKANKVNLGSVTPDVSGGITNSFRFKELDFSFVWTYSLGGKVYDGASSMQTDGGTYHYRTNIPSYYKTGDMWKKEGDNAKLPRFMYGNTGNSSSRWLFSTNHLRLKNITLGYTFPKKWLSKAGLNKIRVFASASNLLTLKKSGLYLDPETPISGIVLFQTPPMRTVTGGIAIDF